jgi:hypothetical protein
MSTLFLEIQYHYTFQEVKKRGGRPWAASSFSSSDPTVIAVPLSSSYSAKELRCLYKSACFSSSFTGFSSSLAGTLEDRNHPHTAIVINTI